MKSCLQLSLLGIGLSLVFSIVDGFGVTSSQSFGADTASRVLNNKSMEFILLSNNKSSSASPDTI